jgi:uncharacterized protein
VLIRDVLERDFETLLILNEQSVHFLSPMDAMRLGDLHQKSIYHRVVFAENRVQAFLMVFAENAAYDSENYRWFCQRYSHFLYIDRVVVSLEAQGKSYGQALYDDLFTFAKSKNFDDITCEYNYEPLNAVSEKFHARNGFVEVGKLWSSDGKKCVSMQSKRLSAA